MENEWMISTEFPLLVCLIGQLVKKWWLLVFSLITTSWRGCPKVAVSSFIMQNCCLQHTQFNGLISSASFPLCCSPFFFSITFFHHSPSLAAGPRERPTTYPLTEELRPLHLYEPLPVSCTTSCLVLGRKKRKKKMTPLLLKRTLNWKHRREKRLPPMQHPALCSPTSPRLRSAEQPVVVISATAGRQNVQSAAADKIWLVSMVWTRRQKRGRLHTLWEVGYVLAAGGRGGRRRNTGTVMTVTSNDCNCVVFLPDSLCESSFYISLTWSGERGASAGDITWPGGWNVPVQPHSQRMAVCRADVTCWDSTWENIVSYKYNTFISLLSCTSLTTFFSHTWTMVQK